MRLSAYGLRRIPLPGTDVKIRSPPGGASSTRESDVRALRQQFGVPKRLLRHTGMYGLWLHQAKPASDQGDDLRLIFIPSGWPCNKGHGPLM